MAKKNTSPETDESEIMKEVGGEPINPDEPNGAVSVDIEKIRELGALDAESIQANRRNQDIVNRKKSGEKHLPFGDPNIITKYEEVIKVWPINTIAIIVNRLTGTQATFHITSQPQTSADLYKELQKLHGRREDTQYEVILRDSYKKEQRGSGRITMPSTLDEPLQQGQPPMNPFYPYGPPPPGYAVPPGYAPAPAPAYAPVPQQPSQPGQPAPPQPPVVQVIPPPQPSTDPMAMMRTMFDMFVQMQQHQAQQQPQQPAPPPPPQQPDPMAMMQQLWQQMQQMQQHMQPPPQSHGRQAPQPQAPPPMMNPMMMGMGMPPIQAPPGMLFVPGFGFVPVEKLTQAISGQSSPPPYRGPAYGPRPSYEGEHYSPRPAYGGPPQQQPQRQRSATEELRDAVTLVRTMANMANEFNPAQHQQQQPMTRDDEEDESPIYVTKAGPAELVMNRSDGSTRAWETLIANAPGALKWAGEQFEKLQKNAIEASDRKKQQPTQQLPPGYVELTPDYKPPPGYVAVPVDQIPPNTQETLPDPPANLPPPIDAPAPVQRPAWGPIPGADQ